MVTMRRKERYEDQDIGDLETRFDSIILELIGSITLLWGPKDSGKTLASVAIARRLRDITGIPLVLNFHPTAEFGPYTYMDAQGFLKQLGEIAQLAQGREGGAELVNDLSASLVNNLDIEGAFMVLDEIYQLFDARRGSSNSVIAFAEWVSQIAHYHASLIMPMPHWDMIEKRIRRQIDFYGECRFNRATGIVYVRLVPRDPDRGEAKMLIINGPAYFDVYDRWNKFAFRKKLIEKAQKDL